MDQQQVKAIIENILFVADSPVTVERLVELFDREFTREEMLEFLSSMREDFENRPTTLVEVAEGWRLQTRAEYAGWVTQFYKMEKGQKLGRAALEALAIIAYRQPITRAEVDEIRGVDSGAALRGLMEKNLLRAMGRRKAPGKPMMYGTTKRFLEYFGLARLADLPTLDEFAEELEAMMSLSPQQSLEFADDEGEGGVSGEVETVEEGEIETLEPAGETAEEPSNDEESVEVEEGGVEEDGLAVITKGFEAEEDPEGESLRSRYIEDTEESGQDDAKEE
ncbi:MAG: SMC-Scp complex subunit ScpB [Nitrospinae bacterium]|nr:SMC-Scp complex subunit ScpB [Nitrospinota bacterium]